MESDAPGKIARNEAIFRDVNEAIESGQWPGERSRIAFRCECAELGCSRLLELTVDEYEHVRTNSRRFIVAHGHQVEIAEALVETHADYLVVEKRDEAGTVAEATDPRNE